MSSVSQHRVWSLDILRGVFIFTMVLAHAIFFFHTDTNAALQGLRFFGDFISFTGLLFISGASGYVAYLHYRHPTHDVVRRVSKRLGVYLAGYFLIAVWADYTRSGWSWVRVLEIVSLQRFVPFTEFLLPFVIFGFLKVPLRGIYNWLSRSFVITVIVSFAVYLLSSVLFITPFPDWLTSVKALLVGINGMYTFPLLSYMPVYILGVYVGRQLYEQNANTFKTFTKLASVAGALFVAVFVSFLLQRSFDPIFMRWPPSWEFLAAGQGAVLMVLLLVMILSNLETLPVTRTMFFLLGQNAFAVFFSHTFLVYLYTYAGLARVAGYGQALVLWLSSLVLSLYIAKIIPVNYRFGLSFFEWCECRLGYCTHVRQPPLLNSLTRLVAAVLGVQEFFTVVVAGRKVRVFSLWIPLVLVATWILFAVPVHTVKERRDFTNEVAKLPQSASRQWLLTSHQSTPLLYTLGIPDSSPVSGAVERVGYSVDSLPFGDMERQGNTWGAQVDGRRLQPGKHRVHASLVAEGVTYETVPVEFTVSSPLFVTWTIDWEGYDAKDEYLQALSDISQEFGIPMTHLFNPRIFVTNTIRSDRAEELAAWVKNRRDRNNEEIGLHLHMFPDFVVKAGVTPKTEPVWGGGFTYGYDILTTAYSYEEMKRILSYAKSLFVLQGLGEPKSYRAGGWFASIDTLRALADSGFLVDTSGRTKYTFGTKHIGGFWDLPTTAQPYYPSVYNQNAGDPEPTIPILEIPNNGGNEYAFSGDEMVGRFTDNYRGGIVESPRQVTYLTHPHWFGEDRQQAMRQVFAYISNWSFAKDAGPVVFTTLMPVYEAFKK